MIYKHLYIIKATEAIMTVSWMLGALLAAACPAQDAVLQAAATAIEAQYLDAAEGARIAEAVRGWSTQQRYVDSCSDPKAFSARLNQDLDTFDGHFHVERVDATAGQDDWLMAWRADARSNGAGVREVRVLEGNIGYLRLCARTAAGMTAVPTCWCARCWTRRSTRCSSWTSAGGARWYHCRRQACPLT